jgi:hypothetical protein
MVPRKFAQPIRDYMRVVHKIHVDLENKEKPMPRLFGKTIRQTMIAFSEKFWKPLFGEACFGTLAAEGLDKEGLVVFSDSGFLAEAKKVISKIGAENVLLVQIRRNDCTFTGDSRRYWTLPRLKVIRFDNSGSKNKIDTVLVPQVRQWLESLA